MNILTLVCGIVGIALFAAFLGFMLWWVKALPLIIIVALCTVLLLYDFVQTLRFGENGGRHRT
jgi:hypothetical protein